ncbi:twisted gastrulation protein homolog 1-like [Corticium candelabrum]|uniref:twisted gastrulation protein homolog 1-like n=1 Tax=Corticium candelabrum TaxID=121492 RepID=UPI002E25971B|nr:twisted gastrulation protein homolog 1-like [Corticium candelabrum]XP_062501891.1 twisted gastrulation protein homolog 1-like [Corticium candelabrum]
MVVTSLTPACFLLVFLCTAALSELKATKCLNEITACQLRDNTCRCTAENGRCPCCSKCRTCLGDKLWEECCDVANLCPQTEKNKVEDTDDDIVIGHLDTPAPDMFWLITDVHVRNELLPIDVYNVTDRDKIGLVAMNCTSAAYWCCMVMSKCIESCKDIGATRFRWYPNCRKSDNLSCGCCECEGSGCIKEIEERPPMCRVCGKNVSIGQMDEKCKDKTYQVQNDDVISQY